MYGNQRESSVWQTPAEIPSSPDRETANLGQPLKHLEGEPDPLALWCLFGQFHKRALRAKLAEKYFGKRKRGPKPDSKIGVVQRKLIA